MMLHHDEDEAIRRGVEGANFFGYSLGHYYVFGEHRPGVDQRVGTSTSSAAAAQGYDPEAVAAGGRRRSGSAPRSAAGDTTGLRGAIGTPEQVREYLRRYEEAGVDQVIFVLQAGRNRHEHIMESIELFGREVLPEFAERDESSSPRRRSASSRSSRRRSPARSALERDLGDYTFPAIPRQWADGTNSDEMKDWLHKFADDRALGKNDASLGINV